MTKTQLSFKQTGFFSKLILDYINGIESTIPFYNNVPSLDGFKHQIKEKSNAFLPHNRKVLVNALTKQYSCVSTTPQTLNNINLIGQNNTFTVTTGHQLNLFTGPLYFLYKIISTLNLSEQLAKAHPEHNFVPIYWMATEDHDFEEINYFNFKGKKIHWSKDDGGAVGQFSTDGLEEVFTVLSNLLGNSKNATFLKELFYNAYIKHTNLAAATRYIANALFAEYGLVVLDGDDKALKTLFIPYIKDDLLTQTAYKSVSETITKLEKNYKVQVNPREINLFYLTKGGRERIILENGIYKVNNTAISFTKTDLLKEIENRPEAFSPNVILRPLYQEVVLPNLAYIGGGGELAYWLQLQGFFKQSNIPFPVLLLRNSVQLVSAKQHQKLKKLGISLQEVFKKQHQLIADKVVENTAISYEFDKKIAYLQNEFETLKDAAKLTDVSFIGAVKAQERKQIKGLEHLKKRLIKAEKRRQKDLVNRITELQNQLLPNRSLEERQRNFSEYYLEYGPELIALLKANLDPLALQFTVLEL